MEIPAIDIDVVSSVAQFLIEVICRHIQSTIRLHVTSQDKDTDTHCVIKFLQKCMHPSSTVLDSQSVLYSAPPIPAGILRNPQESSGMAPESAGILRNPQESAGMGQE